MCYLLSKKDLSKSRSYLEPVEFFSTGPAGRFSFFNRTGPAGWNSWLNRQKTGEKPAGSVTEYNRWKTGPLHIAINQLVLTRKVYYFTCTKIYYMKLTLGVSINRKLCSSLSRSICTDTKTEGKTLTKLFTCNSQQLIWSNIYSVSCLSLLIEIWFR